MRQRIDAFELRCWRRLESPLDFKPVNPKEYQSWIFIVRTDAKAETPILWPPHVKSWLIGKDSDDGTDLGQEEKGMTEDEMAGWHHQLDGHEFEWTPGVVDGQGGLACCSSWGHKESDTIEGLNWTELNWCHQYQPQHLASFQSGQLWAFDICRLLVLHLPLHVFSILCFHLDLHTFCLWSFCLASRFPLYLGHSPEPWSFWPWFWCLV